MSTRLVPHTLGETLHDQGRKYAWLARRVGCSESLIRYLVAGQRTASAELGEKIAEALGVPLGALFVVAASTATPAKEAAE